MEWQPGPETLLTAGDEALASVRDHLLLATSAQLVGLGRKLLDLAVRHVSVREQFGRPLGTLQAVQHRLADVAVGIEFADPVVARAACSLAAGAPSAARDAAMAKVFASEAAERAAYSGLQVHGAIGYTREHEFHLYALRAWALALAHGDARRHRQRVADDLLEAARHPVPAGWQPAAHGKRRALSGYAPPGRDGPGHPAFAEGPTARLTSKTSANVI